MIPRGDGVALQFGPSPFPEAAPGLMREFAARSAVCLAACVLAALPPQAVALDRTQLAVIVNTWDPLSVEIGKYYAARRGISFQNVIKIGFAPGRAVLPAKEFAARKAWADEQALPPAVAEAGFG